MAAKHSSVRVSYWPGYETLFAPSLSMLLSTTVDVVDWAEWKSMFSYTTRFVGLESACVNNDRARNPQGFGPENNNFLRTRLFPGESLCKRNTRGPVDRSFLLESFVQCSRAPSDTLCRFVRPWSQEKEDIWNPANQKMFWNL